MRLRVVSLFVLLLLAVSSLHAQDDSVSFNLSSSKTFAPGEQPKIHLYTHNVDALEFRVYRVNDPVKFLENLRELHSFGPEGSLLGPERVDEKSWLERFHDWKTALWNSIRSFFRHQFSHEARHSLRQQQTRLNRKSRIVSEAEFAQIPVLNSSQLVARWHQQVPSTYISDANDVPVSKLEAGLYLLEATDGRYKAYTLLMVTEMVLVTRTTPTGITAYVVDRVTGAPISGAKVDAGYGHNSFASATTDANGIADLLVKEKKGDNDNLWIVSAKDKDVAVSTPGGWTLNYSSNRNMVGYAFTERPVYRPTHTVHWKAILREKRGNSLAIPDITKAHVAIVDGADQTVFEKDLPVVHGNVSSDYELPKDAALGYYTLRVQSGDDVVVTSGFHVEAYRKPEYRVQVTAQQKRVLQGTTVPVTIDSRYFFGEPVAGGKVKYRIYHERHFWWGESDDDESPADSDSSDDSAGYNGDEEAEKTGVLDSKGVLTIQVPTQVEGNSHSDLDYTVEAGVTDAANREITGRGRFLATYSTFRVNVEPVSYAVRPNEMAKVRVTAVDYDNKPVSTRVHLQLRFRHWESGKNVITEGAATDVTMDASGHATGELPVGTPQYASAEVMATAASVQSGTRDPIDTSYLYILGAGERSWESGSGTAQIVTDKKSYAPGDVAHISIVSEVAGFHALVITEGATLLKREVMHTDGKTLSFDLSITGDAQPNITVSTLFLKNNTLYQATKRIAVPPVQQKLQVEVTQTKDIFQPQQSATYDVLTKDFAGNPVSADVSFGVVDEAIYSLYPDSSGDMVKSLYPQRYSSAEVESSLEYYFSGEAGSKSPMLAERNRRFRPRLAQVKPGNEAAPKVRKAFPDTAYWAPDVHTDSSGHARVTLTFPDSLTTWRATVHAITDDSKAGSASSKVLVRKDVLVRMGTPRFMLKGDEITLPVIVHNYLPDGKTVKVSLNVSGLDVVHAPDATVPVPSKGEATVLWRLKASQVGSVKLVATAITDTESDALEVSFPVEPAGVAKTLASSGVVTQEGAQANASVNFPASTDAAAHSVRIEVSPSIAGSLFTALDYLTSFPYGCTEQTMSSFLPNVIVSETLQRLKPGAHVDEADLHAKMSAGLDRLQDYQHDDGGWGWWKEDDSRIYMTAYVVGGLGQGAQFVPMNAQQKQMINRGMQYLRKGLKDHPKMRPELRAAVVYALANAGDTNLNEALDAQWDRRKDLQPEALAMTGLAMLQGKDARAAEIANLLRGKATRKGELVSWTGSYVPLLDAEYNNDSEATAYAVRLLAKINANDPLLPGAAQWLMRARNNGGWWESTEQTAMVLFGLVDYLAASHELDANFSVDVLVNGKSVGERTFNANDALSGASLKVDLSSAQLATTGNSVQIVRHGGSGRVYWSVRGRYFSTEKKDYQAGTLSLNLTRDYFKLQPTQKDGKVVYSLVPLGTDAQVGDVIAVHEAINGSPMRYLLLEDPIPAGTEFITNEDSYPIDKRPGGWYDWFTRREFHDDRAAFFASDFTGRQEVFYLIRVVNPGNFNISPSHVEPMYQPGIEASSDASHLNVPAPGGAR
ncbi:alpha-2-macroglobulin [Terriglobus sp. TAA 43]|uniref:alpha-2-macroglobulin family protein n=1 Tax=Terriglobus sp. TAA 43 TaxID=278961 RepID=UPI000689A182|nr:alpha-2-macroglobulin family protein [Terriglobus sp. TAA 43]